MKMKESLQDCIKSYIIELLTEGVETKNMSKAKHYLYNKFGYDENQALSLIGKIKTDIPNSRLGKCKFILAAVRMYADGELNDANKILQFNNCLKYAASNAHINEYDNDLNGMSCDEFINRFSGLAASDLEADRQANASQEYNNEGSYEIVKIRSFQEAEEYGEYVDWCVTYDQNMYNSYTKGGNSVFYFCLRDGFEEEEMERGEGCPLDDYGLSMIAVSVNPDGSCSTITCRWNHANGGNDSVMSTKELSNVIGMNFYDVFKPLTEAEIQENKRNILYEIEEELSQYMGYYDSPSDLGCKELNFDPDYGDVDEIDLFVFSSEYVNGSVVLIDGAFNLVSEEVFDEVGYRKGDCMEVNRGNKCNFITTKGEFLSETWFDRAYNEFELGYGLVMKNGLWNALKKDKTYAFKDWYKSVRIFNRFNKDNVMFELINVENGKALMNFAYPNGKFVFDNWFERIFKIDDDNLAIKFSDYYQLYDRNYQLKAPYKITELLGKVSAKYYKGQFSGYYYMVRLDNGNLYLLNKKGDLLDTNTEQIVYKL